MVFEKKEDLLWLGELRSQKKKESLRKLLDYEKKYSPHKKVWLDPFYICLKKEKEVLEQESVSYDISTPEMCFKYSALLDLMARLSIKSKQT